MILYTEKKIENSILNYAMTHLSKDVLLMKINNAGIWDNERKCYRKPNSIHIKKGTPDLFGCVSDGRMLMVEVKTPKTILPIYKYHKAVLEGGKYPATITPTIEAQIKLLHEYSKMGAIAFFVDSIETFLDNLKSHGALKNSYGPLITLATRKAG